MTGTDEYQITFEEYKEVNQAIMKDPFKVTFGRGLVGWILFIGLAVGLFIFINRNAPPPRPAPKLPRSSPWEILVPLLPWLLIFGFIWIFVFRQLRNRYKQAFDSQSALHRRKRTEFDEEGIVAITPLSRSETRWEAFDKYRETMNTFVLHHSDVSVEIIPKRAFKSAEDRDAFRSLLKRHVSHRESAFPVIASIEKQE